MAAALLVLTGCTPTPAPSPAPSVSTVVDYGALESAIETRITSGGLGLGTIDAVMVSVGGETKIAHYRNGSRPEDALHVWSVTKSVVSALIGIAIAEKIIPSLDATLGELLPRYQKSLTAEEKRITLRQLMTMTAGFPGDEPLENIHGVFEQRTDPVPTILSEGPELKPGDGFYYSSRGSHLVSAVLRDALARADGEHPRTVLEYAREKLFDPLEIDSTGAHEERVLLSDPAYDVLTRFDWGTDAAGLHTACCLLRIRPADMIKFGELYLGLGVWHGKQILPPGWVEQTVAPHESELPVRADVVDGPRLARTSDLARQGQPGSADRGRAGASAGGGGGLGADEGLLGPRRRLVPAERGHRPRVRVTTGSACEPSLLACLIFSAWTCSGDT